MKGSEAAPPAPVTITRVRIIDSGANVEVTFDNPIDATTLPDGWLEDTSFSIFSAGFVSQVGLVAKWANPDTGFINSDGWAVAIETAPLVPGQSGLCG